MTIHVDELRTYQTEAIKPAARKHGHSWCHMTSDAADDYEELHAFARRLGLRREYFQGNHYDLTPNMRAMAIRDGATFVPALAGVFSRERASVLAEPAQWLTLFDAISAKIAPSPKEQCVDALARDLASGRVVQRSLFDDR